MLPAASRPRAAQVRRATEQDLPGVLALLQRYFAEGEIQHIDSANDLLRQVRAPGLGVYLAEGAAAVEGCVLCHPFPAIAGAAECKRLYVRPEARGRGVAGSLMDAIEDAARAAGFTWMYLDSKPSFAVAMLMYKRRGYRDCPRFNRNPEATFFFRKRLR